MPEPSGLSTQGLNQVHDGVGDMVSLGMISRGSPDDGGPLGVLMYGISAGLGRGAQSRQKVIDNDTPDKDYGTKMGFVREGDTWYPAIFNQRYKSTGCSGSGPADHARLRARHHLEDGWVRQVRGNDPERQVEELCRVRQRVGRGKQRRASATTTP